MVDFLFVEKFGEKVSVPLQMLSSRCSAGSVKRRGSSKCKLEEEVQVFESIELSGSTVLKFVKAHIYREYC